MELTIPERLVLLSVLPVEGDITAVRIIRKLREALSFSEEEHTKFNLKQELKPDGTSSITWDDADKTTKDVEVGEKATDIIVGAFKNLSNRGKLREEHIPLYDRFEAK